MAISRKEIRRLFRQAIQCVSGAISVSFVTADEALRFRKACYNFREALRAEEGRKRPVRELGHVPTYDIKGNILGLTEFMRLRDKVETEFDCLQFRVVGRELIIRRIAERVLDEERPFILVSSLQYGSCRAATLRRCRRGHCGRPALLGVGSLIGRAGRGYKELFRIFRTLPRLIALPKLHATSCARDVCSSTCCLSDYRRPGNPACGCRDRFAVCGSLPLPFQSSSYPHCRQPVWRQYRVICRPFGSICGSNSR